MNTVEKVLLLIFIIATLDGCGEEMGSMNVTIDEFEADVQAAATPNSATIGTVPKGGYYSKHTVTSGHLLDDKHPFYTIYRGEFEEGLLDFAMIGDEHGKLFLWRLRQTSDVGVTPPFGVVVKQECVNPVSDSGTLPTDYFFCEN